MKKQNVKTVVVAVDFSEYSHLVAKEAKELAAAFNVPLTFVYCFEELEYYEQNILLNRKEITLLFGAKIRETYQVLKDEKVILRFGRPEVEIIDATKKMASPLLVVGFQSGHRMAHFFLGSVAESIAAKASFPVWIHRGNKVVLPKKILVPSDLSKNSEKTIQEVRIFEKKLESTSEIFHVIQEPVPILDFQAWTEIYTAIKAEDDRKLLQFKKRHPKLSTVRVRGYVADDIEKYSKNFDLIAISPRGTDKKSPHLGAVTSKVVRTGHKPILVVP